MEGSLVGAISGPSSSWTALHHIQRSHDHSSYNNYSNFSFYSNEQRAHNLCIQNIVLLE